MLLKCVRIGSKSIMTSYTPEQIASLIAEEEVEVNDNEISSLVHHLEDLAKAYRSGQRQVLLSSLHDIQEIAADLVSRLSPSEQREI